MAEDERGLQFSQFLRNMAVSAQFSQFWWNMGAGLYLEITTTILLYLDYYIYRSFSVKESYV